MVGSKPNLPFEPIGSIGKGGSREGTRGANEQKIRNAQLEQMDGRRRRRRKERESEVICEHTERPWNRGGCGGRGHCSLACFQQRFFSFCCTRLSLRLALTTALPMPASRSQRVLPQMAACFIGIIVSPESGSAARRRRKRTGYYVERERGRDSEASLCNLEAAFGILQRVSRGRFVVCLGIECTVRDAWRTAGARDSGRDECGGVAANLPRTPSLALEFK